MAELLRTEADVPTYMKVMTNEPVNAEHYPYTAVNFTSDATLSRCLDGEGVEVELEDDGYVSRHGGIWRDHGQRPSGVLFYLHDVLDDHLIVGTFVGNVKRIVVP